MRSTAFRLVSRLLALAQKETRTDSVQGKTRFLEEFGPEEGEGTSKADLEAQRGRPAEHTALFAGNSDDHFRLGIKLTRSLFHADWSCNDSCSWLDSINNKIFQ